MLKIIKSNLILIISFIILLIILCINSYKYIQNNQAKMLQQNQIEQKCMNLSPDALEMYDYCNLFMQESELSLDFYTMFYNTTVFGYRNLSFVLFLFVVMPSLTYICKYMKNKQILNENTRNSYKKNIIGVLKKSYKPVFILPTIILISFVICACYTRNFNPAYSIYHSSTVWTESTMNKPLLFLCLYLLNIVVHSILYVNIGIIIARKYHNYFVAIILSFLTFIGIEAFMEIAINGVLFFSILNSDMGMIFNIMNLITFNDVYGMGSSMVVPFCLMLFSSFLVFIFYRKKENLIIDCEKNE